MKIASWNVNSIKVRLPRVLSWLKKESPDILCLQELKGVEEQFPFSEFQALGYHALVYGQKTYNGVAILSRLPGTQQALGLSSSDNDPQARFIAASFGKVHVISAYIPNGSEVGSDKYAYKLDWYRRLNEHLNEHYKKNDMVLLCGDFNVAPSDLDVKNLDAWNSSVLCHEDARGAFQRVLDWGFVDTFREQEPEAELYSWWDYRRLGFQRNDGLRIDFILATQPLVKKLEKAWIDRDERKGDKPSDHVPVLAEFDIKL